MSQDALRRDKSGRDAVDAIIAQWNRERPELDPWSKQITGRVVRLSALFQDAFHETFAPLGISDNDYGVLVALRRAGDPYELTPTDLARQRMVTSGGMTAMIDRLDRRGLVTRSPNPNDRRGFLIRLTEEGLRVVNEAMNRQIEVEHQLVSGLEPKERDRLIALLRKLLLSVDRR
jgi:DNA-binding MarR family transcriptional regulator